MFKAPSFSQGEHLEGDEEEDNVTELLRWQRRLARVVCTGWIVAWLLSKSKVLEGGHQRFVGGHLHDHVGELPDSLIDALEEDGKVGPVRGDIDPVVLVDLGDHLLKATDEAGQNWLQEGLRPVCVRKHVQHVVVQACAKLKYRSFSPATEKLGHVKEGRTDELLKLCKSMTIHLGFPS